MRFSTETKIKIFALCIPVFVFVSLNVFFAKADTVDQLQQQKSDLQKKLENINNQIKDFQNQIASTQKQQASLKNEVFLYDTQIKSTELQIQAKETEISQTNLQINELQNQIERRQKEIADNKAILAGLLNELSQLDGNSTLILTFGNGNFSEFLDQLQYTTNVQDKLFEIVQNIKAVKAKLEIQQAELRVQSQKLSEAKEQLENTQSALEQQRQQKQNLLDRTRGLEKNYQQLLQSSKQESDNLTKEMNDLDDKVRKALGNKTISASSSLAKPIDGVLTQRYGNTGFTSLGYSFHNGVDWAGPAGTPIYAAANGTVRACDTGQAAYGNWCAIEHNIESKSGSQCIITLYAHMRSFKVRAGQTVSQGDTIGFEGNTGNTTRLLYGPDRGYHLHFTVFDCEGFGVSAGKYTKIYGSYTVPYGYTYNPLDFF